MPSYNHYTPQSDGSYRRSTVPENNRRPGPRPPYPGQQHQPSQPHQEQKEPPRPQKPDQRPEHPQERPPEHCPAPHPEPPKQEQCQSQSGSGQGILSFLRGLLPREIDAADLLVISLLLLMNREDCDDDDLSPLLTIALYFLL